MKKKRITKGHKETSGGDGYVYFLHCGHGFLGGCICQNFSLYTSKIWDLLCAKYTSIKLLKSKIEIKKWEVKGILTQNHILPY